MSRAEHPANTYYVHPAGEAGPSVLLNLDLVESLAQWAGYAASQQREIRGVLFGKADIDPRGPTVLAIEDCEPLFGDEAPPHASGLHAVGIVRSDLSGTLLPDDQDRESLGRVVPDPNRVLVLVNPGPEPTARILPNGAGGAAPFPLDRTKLSQDTQRTFRVPSVRAAGGKGLAAIALILALGGGAIFWARARSAKPAARGDVALAVRADGSQYNVRWDPNSTAVRRAGSGVLHVSDAGADRSIPLNAQQLLAGGTSYYGRAPGAAFRLELPAPPAAPVQPAPVSTEPPQVEAPRASAASPTEPPESDDSVSVAPRTPPRERARPQVVDRGVDAPEAAPARPPLTVPAVSEADRRVGDPGELKGESKRDAVPPPEPEPERPKQAVHTIAPRHPSFVATVSYRPALDNPIRRGIHKVPGLRVLQHWRFKGGDNFEPARPIREAKPMVPARVAATLPANANIVLEVFLDARGKVSGIEVATPHANDHFVGAATNAVYGSSFQAARLNGRPVDSRLIASFDFRRQGS